MSETLPKPAEISRGARLAKIALLHLMLWMLAMGVFAAADSWSTLTGFGLAGFLALLSAIVAGAVTTTLLHEWFHLLGASVSGANFDIPNKPGLFVFDWNYPANNLRQFYYMSIAGSIGTLIGIALLWNSVPTDTAARTALVASAIASLGFAGAIEWPVLYRVRHSGDPFLELSKVTPAVLKSSFTFALAIGWITWLII